MSLVYKSSVRENVTDIQTYIVDDSPKSTKYFRVSDVPQVLQKGKNLLRITAHPTNLVPGTQVYVDVRDSNGNAIYYEIPDYLEDDKSRVISIWIYHDKGDDNTPNGEATITLAGIANVDMDGNPLPSRHRDKINVKWQTTVTVDRERSNTSEVIFNSTNLPIVSVSQSIEQYQNQPQDGEGLNLTSQTGKVQYIFRGETPIIEIKDSSTFNSEMVDGSIILNNFSEPAEPINKLANPLSSTFFSSSIKEVLTNKVLKTATNFTTSFENRPDVIHTFNRISEADYKIEYFKTGSNVSTENKRNFANLTFSNVDPITGVVDKIKVLQKSDGLPGEFELLNEVSVPFSSSFDIKVPIPSKNLKDPKILKLLYLNSEGGISRTETISKPFVFDGDNVYIGGSENLISGSIFISNTLGTGIEIGGASSGFIRSVGFEGQTSASIGEAPGGFVIYSGSGNLVMGADQLNGVGMQFIGDNDDRHLIFTTDNGGILDVKTDKFFVGTSDTQFISGSDGNIEISSSIFHLDPAANGGDGSLIIGANATILSDLTVDNLRTPATIDGASSTETNSSSSIKADGFARFVSASVGGWDITTASIEGGNLLMKPEGILQTKDFASGLKGWKISSEGNGTAEFENIRIRGTLRTTTFEKESVNAVGGQLWVANSTTITGSVGLSDTTMSVKNASGFSQGEILLIKKVDNTGFQTEYVLLNSASIDGDNSNEDETHGRIMITRAYGSGENGDFVGDLASSAQSYEDGQVIVSTGKLNTGYIKMNANPNDTATPFIDVVERTGSGLFDVALKARLGDLSGLANSDYVFGNPNPGFGLATENVFLQGGIIANTGSIGGIEMDGGKLFTGGGNYNNSDTAFYVDSGSQFSLGTKLVWNPTTEALVIRGQLQLSDGTDVGTAIENVSTPTGSVARVVSLAADKYVVTFDADGNENPSGQTIVLTATPQNFGTATVYYEFYKDSTIQGSRSTTATFDVNTTLEKPTATSPVTYEVRTFTGSDGGTSISSDSLTLFGIQPGSDGTPGSDGVDAVTAFLTNESHTLPLSSSGDVQSYAGADTLMKVFEGITDSSSNYTYTVSTPSHITATSSSNSVTITATTTPHSGSVTITAASSSVSLAKTMSIAVARQGDDGADGTNGLNGSNAKTLVASVDSQVFAFDDSTDNSATPSSILFSFSQQNLSGTIAASDITITTDDSNSVTNFSFDNNSVSNGSGIVSGSVSYTGGFSSGGLNGSKDSLPLTISCTKDSLTDSIKVFKVEGGLPGSDGSDAVTAFLTNESHTLPSQNDGTVVSFDGATTNMEVFEGITNKTNVYTFSRTSATSVSSSISDNTVTVTSMAHDSGSIVITATSESVSLSKTMTLAKSKQGTAGLAGNDAKLLTLTSDSQVFAFPSASSSTAIDNDILIIVNQQNLSGTIGAGDITIKDTDGNTLSDPTFEASVTDGTGQVSGSITFSGTVGGNKDKLPLTIEVAKDSLEDSLKIFKVEGGSDGTNGADGADAVTAFLTNESHTFPADSSGSIASFTGGTTDMQVFEGITDVTNNYTFTRSSTTSVSSSISDNTITVTSMGHDSGSITINAASSSVSIDKIMSLTKARQGADGGDGTSAKLLIGSLDSPVFAFDDSSDTSATPSNIIFSFQQQNLDGTIAASDITITRNGGSVVTGFDFDNNDVSNGTGIVSGSLKWVGGQSAGGMQQTKGYLPVTISCTKDGLTDSVKIFKVEGGLPGSDGVNAVTAILTNDSHTLPVSSSDEVISFAGASTDIIVFEGTTDVTDNYVISRTSDSHITTTLSGDTVTITDSTTPFSGSVTITATSASVSLAKTMSISQALQGDDGADGAPGSNAKIITLTSDSQVYTFASSSVTTPDDNTIELFFNQQNLSGTIAASDVTITDQLSATHTVPTLSPASLSNGTGVVSGSLVFGTNTPSNKTKFPITISVTKDGVTDSTKIFTLDGGSDGAAGADAYTVILSNESHTIPQASAQSGGARDFTGSGTDITVYKGTTQLDSVSGTPSTNEFKVTATGTDITPGSITVSGNPAVVADHSSMTADSASISYSINVENSATFTKLQSFTTSQTADSGSDGAQGATGPEGPNFDFLSGSLDTVNTQGGLSAGLLMTSNVFGFHKAIAQGSGPPYNNAQLSDFTSFLDSGGSFYLGGNSSGMSGSAATSGYFAWNNTDRSLLISGSNANIQVEKFFVGNSTTQFVSGSNGNLEISGSNFHLDSSGNVKVSGEITVTNSSDFADPNAEVPIIYDFSGNGSQTISNNQVFRTIFDADGEWAGGSGTPASQNSSTEGIYLSSYYTNQPYSDGLLSKNTQQRANNPILNWDFKIQNTSQYTSADIGIFKNNTKISRTDSPIGGNMLYGIRLNQDDILIRSYENEGTATTHSSQFVTGDVLRLQIRVKSEGGAELAIFKNGDFTTPIVTYSYGTSGSESTMTIGYTNASYQMAGHILKYVTFGVGAPSSTVISGNGISTGAIQSSTLTTTSGTEIDLDAAKFKIGGTGAYESNNGILMDGPNALFAVGRKGSSYNYMTFNSASSGKLEINTDNFKVKADGQVTASALLIDGSAQIADTVQIGGSSDGTVVFFDDFTTYAALSDCIADNDDPKTDGSGQGYHLANYDGLADTSLLSGQSDTFNNNGGLLRIGNNEGDDVIWASSNSLIPINASSLYEYEIRLRKPLADGGTDGQYAGFTVYNSDGTTKRSQGDADAFGSQHYFVLNNSSIGTDFETHRGFIKGFGDATSTTSTTKTTPTVFEDGAENGYFAPMFLANWNGQAGRVEIDYIKVTEYAQGGGSSRISGDTITTGVIKSNNLNADSGSQILLNDGSMKMGGTASPGFEVSTEGFVTATNLVEKMVEVGADNSGSYFEYYGSNKTRLLLDGSGGGDVTMNLTLGVAPQYVIHDIQFPSNTTGLEIAKLELTIATTESVQFDENSISSGFFSFGLSLSEKEFGGSLA